MLCQCGCGRAAPVASRTTTERGHVKGQPITFIRGHNQKTVGDRIERPTWSGVHKRLNRRHGPARNHSCVGCGNTAAEWSYDGTDPSELTEMRRGSLAAYSVDLDRYQPRCVSCHRKFDEAGARDRDARGQFSKSAAD